MIRQNSDKIHFSTADLRLKPDESPQQRAQQLLNATPTVGGGFNVDNLYALEFALQRIRMLENGEPELKNIFTINGRRNDYENLGFENALYDLQTQLRKEEVELAICWTKGRCPEDDLWRITLSTNHESALQEASFKLYQTAVLNQYGAPKIIQQANPFQHALDFRTSE